MFNFNKRESSPKKGLDATNLKAGDQLISPQGLPFTVMAINNGVPTLQFNQASYELGRGGYEGVDMDQFGQVKLPTSLEGFTFDRSGK